MKKLLFCCILLLIFACGKSDESKNYNNFIGNKLKWEKLHTFNRSPSARLKVLGGWIVRSETGSYSGGIHQIFIADSLHEWRIK